MIFKNLWERHLFHQLLKTLFFALACFYLLYIVIDYSIHSHHFSKNTHLGWIDVGTYYFYLLTKRSDLVLPLAFIIASNKVLLGLNQSHAMIALLVGGLNKLILLRPLFLTALLVAMVLFVNFESITPRALAYLEMFEHQNFKKPSAHNYAKTSAYRLSIDQSTFLLFSKYHVQDQYFEDVYYIRAPEDIWKMKRLELTEQGSAGHYVEHLVRDAQNLLIKEHSYPYLLFPHLQIDPSFYKQADIPLEQKSLSSLYALLQNNASTPSIASAPALTQLMFKLSTPFISFLLIIACAPFCMNFSRKLPIFMIYAMSIFGVIAFFIIMDACVILGENKTVNPYIIISMPYLVILLCFFGKFNKVCLK